MEKLIYNFFEKTKGTISVFLVIILVPVMAMCSLFVDASRIKLAQSVIASSSDLALNAVLADFDSQLAELYGLMSSCQDEAAAVNAAKEYFKASMVSQGVVTTQAEQYADTLADMFGGTATVNDLLDIAVENLNISVANNGSLTNTAIFKDQIVEFMKYRGPVEAVNELIDKFTSIKKSAENAEDETKMIEEMEDYCEAENDLLDALEKAYKAVKEYNSLGVTNSYITDLVSYVSKLEDKYKPLHTKTFKDLFNTFGVSAFSYTTITTSVKYTTYNQNSIPTQTNAEKLIKNCANAIVNYNYKNNTLTNTVNGLPSYDGAYGLQYWVQCSKTLASNSALVNYANYSQYLCNYYGMLKNLDEYLTDDVREQKYILTYYNGVNTSGEKTIGKHIESLKSQMNGIVKKIGSQQSDYYVIAKRLKSLSDSNYSKISRTDTNNEISSISSTLTTYYNKIDEAQKKASDISDKFIKIGKKVEALNNCYKDWNNAANKSNLDDSDLAKENREVLKNLDKDTMKNVTPESVSEIKTRFDNINNLLKDTRSLISETKYGSKKKAVKDIKNITDFINASGIDKNQIVVNNETLKTNANNSFKFYKSSNTISVNQSNNPDITVNKPDLWKYMDKKFTSDTGDMSKSEAEKQYKKKKKDKSDSTKDADTSGNSTSSNEIKGQSGLPSSGSGAGGSDAKVTDQISNVASFIGSFFDNFGDGLENSRDTLYELLYITNMFSYDTFEKEGKYKLANDGKIGGLSLSQLSAKYATVDSSWKNESKTFTDNKTLTNHMINSSNNYSYGNEIEYILYGNTNSKNKASAYSTIFAIRYAFNLTYAFTHIYNDSALVALANAIAAATYGVIPAPLTQTIVTLGLCAAESVYDIQCLKEGMPVAIFKDNNNWLFKFSGNPGDNKNISNKINSFQYSDYLTLFLFLKLISNENAILKRTEDVIQTNMRLVNGYGGFLMSNCHVYYKLTADCKTPYLILSLPVISSSTDTSTLTGKSWNSFNITSYRGY